MQDQPEELNALVRKHLLESEHDLAIEYQPAQSLPVFSSKRAATCSGESGKEFKGDYRSIELRDCSNITIRDAQRHIERTQFKIDPDRYRYSGKG